MAVREDKKRETRARLERDSDADLTDLRAHLAAQDRSLPAVEATRLALVAFSQRIGTPMNAERARVIEANPALAGRGLQLRQVWAEAIAAKLAARRGLSTPDERDRLGGLLVVAILLSAFRVWSGSTSHPGSLREAVDRTASWAAEMLQP
jgi:MftR C-terminal domain